MAALIEANGLTKALDAMEEMGRRRGCGVVASDKEKLTSSSLDKLASSFGRAGPALVATLFATP